MLLTDVAGVYDRDPRRHGDTRLLARVDDPDSLGAVPSSPGSEVGRGGMRSKVEAAAIAARAGCQAVIATSMEAAVLPQVLAGEEVGTWFPARAGLAAKRRWIAFAVAPRGALHLDPGAVAAVRRRGASLLAAGVERVEGDLERGDVVELRDGEGMVVGRGIVSCDADAARAWCRRPAAGRGAQPPRPGAPRSPDPRGLTPRGPTRDSGMMQQIETCPAPPDALPIAEIAHATRDSQRRLGSAAPEKRSAVLRRLSALLAEREASVLDANRRDLEAARASALAAPLLHRLELSPAKLATLRQGVEQLAAAADPVGRAVRRTELDDGLTLRQVKSPLGVLLIISRAAPRR